ncbi:MAG TPA: ABC transporter substrate-binding protein [Trebonia sp.]
MRRGVGLTAAVLIAATGTACASSGSGGSGASAPGVTSTTVTIGTSNALTGTNSASCSVASKGEQAWIDYVNANGGINGRKIKVNVIDDGFTPARAVANAKTFINQPVFAVVGGCGTATADAAYPVLNSAGVPFLFPYASIASMVQPPKKYVYSFLPLYQDQDKAIISADLPKYGPGSVYFIAGSIPGIDQVEADSKAAVLAAGGTWAGGDVVTIGTADFTPYVLRLKAAKPDYVMVESTGSDSARIVNAMVQNNALPTKRILGVSILADRSFTNNIPAAAQNLLSIVAPTPPAGTDKSKQCEDVFSKYAPDMVGVTNAVFGCAQAQAFVAALKAAGPNPTRDGLINALNAMKNVNAGNALPPLTFTADNHVGASSLFILGYAGGKWSFDGTAGL